MLCKDRCENFTDPYAWRRVVIAIWCIAAVLVVVTAVLYGQVCETPTACAVIAATTRYLRVMLFVVLALGAIGEVVVRALVLRAPPRYDV